MEDSCASAAQQTKRKRAQIDQRYGMYPDRQAQFTRIDRQVAHEFQRYLRAKYSLVEPAIKLGESVSCPGNPRPNPACAPVY